MGGEILKVCLMGIGIVFFGLVCIIALCKLMSIVLKTSTSKTESVAQSAAAQQPVQETEIPNREEMVAALSAVVAEELGKDVSAIRIVSLKKL